MIAYLIKVSLCWILFYALYQLLYKKITFFSANGAYLMLTLILGALIPLLQYVQLSTPEYQMLEYVTPILYEVDNIQTIVAEQKTFDYMQALTILYALGLCLFLLRFFIGMNKIYQMYSLGEKENRGNYVLVYTDKPHLPFSFYKWVFISKQIPLKEKVNTVLKHELCHVDERHSVDVILLELIKIIFWCSPPIYLYKKALKQVHEYIADNVTLVDQDKEEYGQLLLGQSSSGIELSLTHQFFNSHLKKRITMMNQKRSSKTKLVLYLALVPVLMIMGLSFTNYIDNSDGKTEQSALTDLGDPIKEIEKAVSLFFSGQKANKTTMQEAYEELVKKYPKHVDIVQAEFKKNAFMRGMSLDVNSMEENRKYIIDTISTFDYDTYEETVRIVKVERGKDPMITKRTSYDLFDTVTVFNADTYEETVRIVRTEGDPKIAQEVDKGLGDILLQRNELKDGKCARQMSEYYHGLLQKYPEKKNIVQKYTRDFFRETALHPTFEKCKLMGLRFISSARVPAPPPPPPPSPGSIISDNGEVFKVVEEMPRFPGCEDIIKKNEREKCAKEKMLHFIYKNLQYPAEARKAGIQGMCVVQFVIEKDGSVSEINLVRDIGNGCGKASTEVVQKMNQMEEKWIPGKQRGQKVRVMYTLPIRYKLENGDNTSTKTAKGADDITLIAHGESKEKREYTKVEEKENFIIILDGEEVEDLKSLDKMKIRTVTVLKGASAIEKYGMRAKDGVVILQTGDSGKELSSTYTEMRSVGEMKVNDFKVYPNPANDQLDISFKTTEKGDIKIHIFDLEGKVLRQHSSYSDIGNFNKTFNLSDIAPGNLFLTIEQNDKVLTQKVIKQ